MHKFSNASASIGTGKFGFTTKTYLSTGLSPLVQHMKFWHS